MDFFDQPILNSPYAYPSRHWELDADGRPTNRILETRRRADLVAPIPKPKKGKRGAEQAEMRFHRDDGISGDDQEYNPTWVINEIRGHLDAWRALPNLEPGAMAGDARDGPAPAALADARVLGHAVKGTGALPRGMVALLDDRGSRVPQGLGDAN